MLNQYKKQAFTLAEVLITIMIIGVLAMITIPGLLQSWEKTLLKNELKTSYSILSQAVKLCSAETGQLYNDKPYPYFNTPYLTFAPRIRPYFKHTSEFQTNGNPTYPIYGYGLPELSNSNIMKSGAFTINNKQRLFFNNEMYNSHLYITVDINGPQKKPNKLGYDIFTFEVAEGDLLIPAGSIGSQFENKNLYCNQTGPAAYYNGHGCTYYALKDECPSNAQKGYWECLYQNL